MSADHSADHIDQCLVLSRPVELCTEVERYFVEHDGPGLHPILGYGVAIKLGERVISRCDYTLGQGKALVNGQILAEPVQLALLAQRSPGRDRGLLHVALAAATTTLTQEAEMRDADRSLSEGFSLWTMPYEQVRLPLGERWFPAGPELLELIPLDADPTIALPAFVKQCRPFFDRILLGDPSEESRRILESVPGISGEVGC